MILTTQETNSIETIVCDMCQTEAVPYAGIDIDPVNNTKQAIIKGSVAYHVNCLLDAAQKPHLFE